MFGPKIRNVFKSRWHAVFWSLGVLLTAYCSVPSPDDSMTSAEDQKAAEELIKQLLPQEAEKPHHHVNPWAKTKPDDPTAPERP